MTDADSPRPRVTYVTDLERTPAGGGAYVVNYHAFNELSKCFDAHYAGPIVPRLPLVDNMVSKVRRRVLSQPGRYVYFSPETLDENARAATSQFANGSEAIVFRSSGRWCRCRPSVPYFVYLDAVVHTFFHNTFDERDFERADLERIWGEEASFLEGAAGVFFESEWGIRMARQAYGLKRSHYHFAGRGGGIDPPRSDAWDGASHRLVTIAMNFKQKGGDVVREAYHSLKPRFPSLTWDIVGGPPDFAGAAMDGVTYHGALKPSEPDELTRLTSVLRNAFLLLHPTREDTSPLVITEAAYFGCPSISVNAFALPELVADGRSGVLLSPPADSNSLAAAIEELIVNSERYADMRKAARDHALAAFRWETTGAVMCDHIDRIIRR